MAKRDNRSVGSEVELERVKNTLVLRLQVAYGIISIGKVVSYGVPGFFLWKVFETFGGKTTSISISFITQVSIIVSMASVAAVITAWTKMKRQKGELIRLRARISELEELVSKTTQTLEKER